MKDKKKLIIIIAIAVLVIAGIIVAVIFIPKKNKPTDKTTTTTTAAIADEITIKFDTQDGEKIENMKAKKGEKVTLPEANKEGYTFDKWVDDKNTEYTTEATFENDVTLTAKYTEIKADAKTVKVTYDSKGGSKVSATTYECKDDSITIKLPKAPTKDGYNFVSWADKNGKVILGGAKLTCENITLYANWEAKKTETQKTYKCDEGELKGTKCEITKDAEGNCPSGMKWSDKKSICYGDKKDEIRVCKKKTLNGTQVDGEYIDAGYPKMCGYGRTYSSYDGQKETCQSKGAFYGNNSKCYNVGEPNNYETKCPDGYANYNAQELNPEQTANACYKTSNKTYTCPSDYTLNGTKCVKTVDARVE